MALTDNEEHAIAMLLRLPGVAASVLPFLGDVEGVKTAVDVANAAGPLISKIADAIGAGYTEVFEVQGTELIVDKDLIEMKG